MPGHLLPTGLLFLLKKKTELKTFSTPGILHKHTTKIMQKSIENKYTLLCAHFKLEHCHTVIKWQEYLTSVKVPDNVITFLTSVVLYFDLIV